MAKGGGNRCFCCTCGWIIFVIGALLLAAGLVVKLAVLPNVLTNTVNDMKVIQLSDDGSMNTFTSSWSSPQYGAVTQFWIYDYANTGGIMNRGSFPDADEKGPYSYTTKITNPIKNFSSDGNTVDYVQKFVFTFNKELSCHGCDPKKDLVKVPDIAFQIAMGMIPPVEDVCNLLDGILPCETIESLFGGAGSLLTLLNAEPFIKVTVDQLLFSGYVSPLVDSIEEVNITTAALSPQVWGAYLANLLEGLKEMVDTPINFMRTNNTEDLMYTAGTGKDDPAKTGNVYSFTNLTDVFPPTVNGLLPELWWNTTQQTIDDEYCPEEMGIKARNLEGTLGDFFKSFITKKDVLPIFVSDICRTLNLKYHSDITVNDVDGYRFVVSEDSFNPRVPENCGFCKKLKRDAFTTSRGSRCLPQGFLDISGCQRQLGQELPIVISNPHFLQADKTSIKFMPRFKPSFDDATTLDIEPTTGTLLQANKRLQINMFIGQSDHTAFNSLKVMRSGAYPLFWLNQSVTIDNGTKETVTSSLSMINTVTIICWCAVGVGAFLIVLSLIMLICQCTGKSKKED